MEVAARLGGGHDADLCLAAVGVDLNGLAIAFALGADSCGATSCDKVSQEVAPRVGGACVIFLVAPEGELLAVEGVDDAAAVEGVEWVRLHGQPGRRFGPLRRGADRAGAILATGAARDEALARARRAADTVRFQVDATPA